MIGQLLTMSKACDKCKGTGKIDKEPCDKCNGSGVILDNTIGDLILKYAPQIKKSDLGILLEKIYKHFSGKLEDSYYRGKRDAEQDNK